MIYKKSPECGAWRTGSECRGLMGLWLLAGLMGGTAQAYGEETENEALEEVLVTAQRQEQRAQDVPIALEVFGGVEVRRQGYRDMDALANFSPTVLILPRVQDQDISIRGFGTTGNALTLDQAAPMFIDGVHFGRSSQSRLAFMDVESVEILKGPQPVYFGQNATAGAFNVRSRGPTDSWQANLDAELAERDSRVVDFGIGGPLGEHWGVRLAGKHETTDGFLRDVVSGKRLGAYENQAGRAIFRWRPTDSLRVSFKAEASEIRKDGETTYLCRTDGPMLFGRRGPTDDPGEPPGDERSVWAEPPIGSGWSVPFTPLDTDCFTSDKGVSNGGPYFVPPANIREENSNFGALDIREAAEAFTRSDRNRTTAGYEDVDANNAYLEIAYAFGGDVEMNWLNAWSEFDRDYALENSNSPFLMNLQARGERFDQISSELRFNSVPGGKIDWTLGAFWQESKLFGWSSSLRANVRQMQRYNVITEEVEHRSLFGNVTFNFLDDRLSLDLGGRFSDVDKRMTVVAYGASWVFDVEPVSAGTAGVDYFELAGDELAAARIYLPPATGARLWYMPFRGSRVVPVEWLGVNARPIGLTAPDYNAARLGGPWDEPFKDSEFDPQVAVRYRVRENLTVYARYAESFKIGGFDTGQTSVPDNRAELIFESEHAEAWELGVKGSHLDGRLQFDLDLFELEIPDLQTTALSPDPDQTTASVNAGQRVRGLEFSTRYAASERLILGLSGAFMDGVMTDFKRAGCTPAELADPNSGCVLADPDDIGEGGLIDRTGSQAPRTPDWKFVVSASYRAPVLDHYELFVDARAYASDAYIIDVESFDQVVKYNRHEDLNLSVGIGAADGRWRVSVFGRNLLEARPSYNAALDIFPNGLAGSGDDTGVHLSPSSFATYGLKFEYFMR